MIEKSNPTDAAGNTQHNLQESKNVKQTYKTQRFLTYAEQIGLLRSQGLMIRDEAYAEQTLASVGYYELINGYKSIFKEKSGGSGYRPGTMFEDLTALYKFDENLRELFFKYILRIEIHLRALLSYAFCQVYGSDQQAYLDASHYDDAPEKQKYVYGLIKELAYTANRSEQAVYVVHQRQKYGNVPLWVLFKATSLGILVRFYSCCKKDIRRFAAGAFPNLREDTLGRMLEVMRDFRNVCAHNDCLYSFRSDDSIPPMPVLRYVTLPVFSRQRDGAAYCGDDICDRKPSNIKAYRDRFA